MLDNSIPYRQNLFGDLIISINSSRYFSWCWTVSQFVNVSCNSCYCCLRIIHYIRNTSSCELPFSENSHIFLHTYADADWVGCPDTRCSIIGLCVFMGESLIHGNGRNKRWCPSLQLKQNIEQCLQFVLRSNGCVVSWMSFVILFLPSPTPFDGDNSAISIVSNPMFPKRMKIIEVIVTSYKIIFWLDISLCLIYSLEQPADIFTKSLFELIKTILSANWGSVICLILGRMIKSVY